MTITFDAAPQSRRELREREELLRKAGASADQAARFASAVGIIDLSGAGTVLPLEATTEAPEPEFGDEEVAEASPILGESFGPLEPPALDEDAESEAGDFEEPAELAKAVEDEDDIEPVAQPLVTGSVDEVAAGDEDDAIDSPTELAEDEPEAEPEVEVDFEVVEVVEQIFSQPVPVQDTPTSIPIEPGTATGPIHWTEALAMPADLDPTDPASIAELPALTSDTNTIVLDETPNIHEVSNQTGEIQLMVTGSILLPTELTETGALSEMLDTQEVEFNEDTTDEVPLSHLNPVSALSAVSASADTPAMIADPPKEKLSTAALVSIIAGGAAAVVLIALGVGALFHLF